MRLAADVLKFSLFGMQNVCRRLDKGPALQIKPIATEQRESAPGLGELVLQLQLA
jgi:hypothetical protein